MQANPDGGRQGNEVNACGKASQYPRGVRQRAERALGTPFSVFVVVRRGRADENKARGQYLQEIEYVLKWTW